MELVLTWQQQRLMGRAFQLVAICVPRPEPTRRPRPMRALCPTNQKVTHSPQCVSPGKVDVPRWTGQRQGYDKSAFLIHKHVYTMISSDPHHNLGGTPIGISNTLQKRKWQRREIRGLAPSHPSQGGQAGTRTQVSYRRVQLSLTTSVET